MTSRVALGAILLGGGALWLLSNAGLVDVSYQVLIGVLLIAIGVAIAFTPGRHGWLTALGILVLLAGLPALVVDDFVTGSVGDVLETPLAPPDVDSYEHGIGKLTIDLTSPGLADADLDVEASVGIGDLLVLVPESADVVVDAHVGVGNIDALGREQGGLDVDLVDEIPGAGEQEIGLELEVGIGDIRVRYD